MKKLFLEKFTAADPMPFGQYKGMPLGQLSASYLLFLFRSERSGRITDYIRENMDDLLKKEAKEPRRKRRRR